MSSINSSASPVLDVSLGISSRGIGGEEGMLLSGVVPMTYGLALDDTRPLDAPGEEFENGHNRMDGLGPNIENDAMSEGLLDEDVAVDEDTSVSGGDSAREAPESDRDEPAVVESGATGVAVPEKKLPFWKLAILTAAGGSCQLSWAVQIGYSTKTFLELGMPESAVSYAWLAGPVSGIIVQPIVGIASDATRSRLGRRKPYVAAGVLFIVIGLMLFCNSEVLGRLFGDTEHDAPVGVIFAVFSFFMLDFSINTLQGPIRTLVSDVCPPRQQDRANAMYSLMGSAGNLVGSGLGALPLSKLMPFFGTDLRALYSIAAVLVVFVTMGTMVVIREAPLPPKKPRSPMDLQVLKKAKRYAHAIRVMPNSVMGAWLVQSCTWFSWFCTFIFVASWVGFLYGNPKAEKGSHMREEYDRGVRLGNVGLALQAAVAIVYSLILPWLLALPVWKGSPSGAERKAKSLRDKGSAGTKPLYFCSQMVMAGCLVSSLWIKQGWLAVTMIGLLGISWGTTLTIPWAITARAIANLNDKGLYMSVMNLSQCWPEILASIFGNVVLSFWHDHSAPLFSGGLVALLGALFVLVLKIDPQPTVKEVGEPGDGEDVEDAAAAPVVAGAILRGVEVGDLDDAEAQPDPLDGTRVVRDFDP